MSDKLHDQRRNVPHDSKQPPLLSRMITEETDLNKRLREAKGWEKIKQVRTWHLGGIGYHPISCPSRFKRGRVDSVVRYNEVESAKVVMAR